MTGDSVLSPPLPGPLHHPVESSPTRWRYSSVMLSIPTTPVSWSDTPSQLSSVLSWGSCVSDGKACNEEQLLDCQIYFLQATNVLSFSSRQMFYLFGMIGVSYALLWLVPPSVVQRYSMVWAMGCISAAHTYRLVTDFGGYHLDFTG